MSDYKIDELDQQVIQLLSEDARLSNRKIATQLGFALQRSQICLI